MKGQRTVLATSLLLGGVICIAAWIPVFVPGAPPYRTLIVGGGPDNEHNQVAIESNVRYLERLLPTDSPTRVLFTDGDPQSKNILCQDGNNKTYYKKTDIPHLDGASEIGKVKAEISQIASDVQSKPDSPVLLYFTGHGSPNYNNWDNNSYDLWNHKSLSVKSLAGSLKEFPKNTPITVVMVECFSGAFGNLLFQEGDPKKDLADLNLCGFFASVAQRPAAGCTPELNEENYRDFTSYFFAALTGTDRMGKRVTGADYNHDGKVGMDEAFAYCLLHDDSIDTPVCTSDVFLRHYFTMPDKDILEASYRDIRSWASPSQLAALDGLSKMLDLRGDDRALRAYESFLKMNMNSDSMDDVHLIRFVRLAKSIVLKHMMEISGEPPVKARFNALLEAESGNPLR